MAYFARHVDTCPHREVAASKHDTANCTLVCHLTGQSSISVDTSVCQHCCKWPEPNTDHWNPVIGSLVLGSLDETEGQRSRPNAEHVRHLAMEYIDTDVDSSGTTAPDRQPPADVEDVSLIVACMPPPSVVVDGPSEPRGPDFAWAVGITTAPRSHPTLPYCIDALARAGWTDAFVFADGDVSDEIESRSLQLEWIRRSRAAGGWSNYVLAAHELVHRRPHADAYLLLQDDAMLTRWSAIRSYIELVIASVGASAVVSLYSSIVGNAELATNRWSRFDRPYLPGAQGVAFTQSAMHAFVADSITRPWEWSSTPRRPSAPFEQRGIDGKIGRWAHATSTPMWLPSPSLIWHLGDTSTLWPHATMTGIRRANGFLESTELTDHAGAHRGSTQRRPVRPPA
ncbi:MAG: hypothetical protein AAF670_08480 [Planctomycetota bacterium]